MMMSSKRIIGGSGNGRAGEALAQRVKLGIEVGITADEISRGQQHNLDFLDAVVPPHPELEVNSNDCDSYEKPVVIYTNLCDEHNMCFLWLLPTPSNSFGIQILWLCSLSP